MWAVARIAALVVVLTGLAARGEQEVPIYPGAVHTRIGNDLVIGGEYFRLAYFTTTDSMEKVAKYFQRYWSEQGYPVITEGDFKEEGIISAFYTREGLQRTVVLRMYEGKLVGFTSLRDLWQRAPKPKPPVQLENTLYSSAIGDRTATGTSDQQMSILEAPAQDTLERLEKAFAENGFAAVERRVTPRSGGKKGWELEHVNRSGQRVSTSVIELEEGLTAVEHRWSTEKSPPESAAGDAPRAGGAP